MTLCRHHNLSLIPDAGLRLRCRHCHLSITVDELAGGCCPECFEQSGQRYKEFEEVATDDITRYRCEECGIIVQLY
jgi:hypothetical protein